MAEDFKIILVNLLKTSSKFKVVPGVINIGGVFSIDCKYKYNKHSEIFTISIFLQFSKISIVCESAESSNVTISEL